MQFPTKQNNVNLKVLQGHYPGEKKTHFLRCSQAEQQKETEDKETEEGEKQASPEPKTDDPAADETKGRACNFGQKSQSKSKHSQQQTHRVIISPEHDRK